MPRGLIGEVRASGRVGLTATRSKQLSVDTITVQVPTKSRALIGITTALLTAWGRATCAFRVPHHALSGHHPFGDSFEIHAGQEFGRVRAATVGHGDVPVHRHRGLDGTLGIDAGGHGRGGAGPRRHRPLGDRAPRRPRVRHGGDSFCAAFSSAVDAVTAAVESQRELDGDEAIPFTVRMALHTGEAIERDGNYYGTEVNRAARLMALAHGGQVLVSDTAEVLVRSRVRPAAPG